MTVNGWLQILVFCAVLIAIAPLLGGYMAKVYTGQRVFLTALLSRPEKLLYRSFGIDPARGQDWKSYAKSLIVFSLVGWLILYLVLRTQSIAPWAGYGG